MAHKRHRRPGKRRTERFPDRLMRLRTLAWHGEQNSNGKQREACDRLLRLRDQTQDDICSPDGLSAPNHGPVTWAAGIDRTGPHNKKRDSGVRGSFASHDHRLSGGYDDCCESGGSVRIANRLTVGEHGVLISYGGQVGMTAGCRLHNPVDALSRGIRRSWIAQGRRENPLRLLVSPRMTVTSPAR